MLPKCLSRRQGNNMKRFSPAFLETIKEKAGVFLPEGVE
jgi:hypothetical protein